MADEKKTILIVDDDSDIRVYLSTFLEDNGYVTVTACDGVEAWTQVEAESPDLVTLDITMPEKSGVRFYRDMKEDPQRKDIPIIIITGVTGNFEQFISTRKQVPPPDGFVQKPIDRDKVLELVKSLTD
jgi:CheY-like chemotaxis protein